MGEALRTTGAADPASTGGKPWSIGQCVALACLLEATAPKPGNVHRGADFEDVTYPEFVASGIAIAPVLERTVGVPLGQSVLEAVEATRAVTATNTNLGTILLLAPLAAVPRNRPLAAGVAQVLRQLSAQDARNVYAAIRLARPGGLGRVVEADVNLGEPPDDLMAAMRLAADRDLVARQYAEDFRQVFTCVVPWLEKALGDNLPLDAAIVRVQLELMRALPDSLIAANAELKRPPAAPTGPPRFWPAGRPTARRISANWRSSIFGCAPTGTAATRAQRPTCWPPACSPCCATGCLKRRSYPAGRGESSDGSDADRAGLPLPPGQFVCSCPPRHNEKRCPEGCLTSAGADFPGQMALARKTSP